MSLASPTIGARLPCESTALSRPLCIRALLSKREIAALVLVLAAQCFYFVGIAGSDDLNYYRLACVVRDGQPIPQELSYFVGRFVHWKPIQAAVTLAPHNPWLICLPAAVGTWGALACVLVFARKRIAPAAGWTAVLLLGLVPVVVLNASVAYPDPLAAALAWIGVCVAAPALVDRATGRPLARCFAGGLLILCGYSAKESVAALVPGLALFVLLFRTRCLWAWSRLTVLAAGAALWLCLEAALMWRWTGDPLFHSHAVAWGHLNAGMTTELTPSALLSYWADYLRWMADPRSEIGPIGLVLLAGLAAAFFRRTAYTNLLLCCVLPALIYLSVGSSQSDRYFPLCHQPRYLVPLLPGMALIAAGSLHGLLNRARLPLRLAAAAVGGLVLLGALIAPDRYADRWYHAATFRAGYDLLKFRGGELQGRLIAGQLSYNRLAAVPNWTGVPSLELLQNPPRTVQEWVSRYPGAHVLVTRHDRRMPEERHAALALADTPLATLQAAGHLLGRTAPPLGRLEGVWNRLWGRPVPLDDSYAVEIWQVPTVLPQPVPF